MQFTSSVLAATALFLSTAYAASDAAVVTQIGDGQIQAGSASTAATSSPAPVSSYEAGAQVNAVAYGAAGAGFVGLAALLL